MEANGVCGSNTDYVLNLYKYMKENFPFVIDEHLEDIVYHLSPTQLEDNL